LGSREEKKKALATCPAEGRSEGQARGRILTQSRKVAKEEGAKGAKQKRRKVIPAIRYMKFRFRDKPSA
jgi:hypothetical protein